MIPAELRALDQWLAWKWANRRDRYGELKPTKIPLDPKPVPAFRDGLGRANNPESWGTYRQALAMLADGVGFVFSKDDPFTGVDIDGCFTHNGALHVDAWNVVKQLGSYVEVSPSGYGLHVIVRGSLKRNRSLKQAPWGAELAFFDHGKFFTVEDGGRGEIREAQDALTGLISYYFPEPHERPLVKRWTVLTRCDNVRYVPVAQITRRNGQSLRAIGRAQTGRAPVEEQRLLAVSLRLWDGNVSPREPVAREQQALLWLLAARTSERSKREVVPETRTRARRGTEPHLHIMGTDAAEVPESLEHLLSPLRWSGHHSRSSLGLIRTVPCGHGGAAPREVTGPHRQRRSLFTRELSVGYSRRAEPQPARAGQSGRVRSLSRGECATTRPCNGARGSCCIF